MSFQLKPWNRGISNEKLLEDIRQVAKNLGKASVTYDEYDQHGICASNTSLRRFGSWNAALRAAGLDVGRRQNISKLELFENLADVWTTIGRQPARQELQKPVSRFCGETYANRFGGWRKALEAFVAYANGEATLTAPDSVQTPSPTSRRFPDLRVRWRVMNRDSFRCQSCGRSPAFESEVILHVDHIVPWSKGGATREENLRTLCSKCNIGKSDLV
jgi:hypothetical protein